MNLPWKAYVIGAASVLLIWVALRSSLGAEAASVRYFPLEKGNYWVYQGETKWSEPAGRRSRPEVKTAVLTWKMEVVDTLAGSGWQAALLKGFPGDLAWYEAKMARGDHLILLVSPASYYLFHEADARDIWAHLQSGKPLPPGVATPEALFFTAPLARGRVYGGSKQNVKRGLYCWVVKGERAFDSRRFPLAPTVRPPRAFTLVYSTTPDTTTIDFVPGLGVVGYQYRHHGTTAETNLGLVEFGTARPAPQATPVSSKSPDPG